MGGQTIHLLFDDTPEVFHRTVVNTSTDAGHALHNMMFFYELFKAMGCILKSTITMKECLRWNNIILNLSHLISYLGIVIMRRFFICDNLIFTISQDSTKVSFRINSISEFSNIR